MASISQSFLVRTHSIQIGRNGSGDSLIESFSAEILPGTVTALIGPNGCGKTTLLKVLSGLLLPRSGSVHYGHQDIKTISAGDLARKRALVLTDRPQLAYMTALDITLLGRAPYTGRFGRISRFDTAIARKALSQTGAASLEKREFRTLSDGEKQRVLLARALAQETPLVFLDEPTAFLDAGARESMIRLLKSTAEETAVSFLFSTHDLKPALSVSDYIWIIHRDGKFEQRKDCKNISEADLLANIFTFG